MTKGLRNLFWVTFLGLVIKNGHLVTGLEKIVKLFLRTFTKKLKKKIRKKISVCNVIKYLA